MSDAERPDIATRFNSETGAEAGRVAKKFEPVFVEQAKKLAQLGAIDLEIADFFEVSDRTIRRWKLEHPDFGEALQIGKDVADERVKQSLFRKATGYTFSSEKVFQYEGKIIRAEITEHVAPSDVACIFWLKNRDPANWRDSSQIDHSSSDGSMSPQAPVYNIVDK